MMVDLLSNVCGNTYELHRFTYKLDWLRYSGLLSQELVNPPSNTMSVRVETLIVISYSMLSTVTITWNALVLLIIPIFLKV